jgi:hypothetical protein
MFMKRQALSERQGFLDGGAKNPTIEKKEVASR